MAELPRAVLSWHLQERMKGRRLVSAVFLTFRFDPAFFNGDASQVLIHFGEQDLGVTQDQLLPIIDIGILANRA